MFATMMETPLKEAPITPATGIRSNRSSTSPGHLELDYITYILYILILDIHQLRPGLHISYWNIQEHRARRRIYINIGYSRAKN